MNGSPLLSRVDAPQRPPMRVALLGCGTVGSAVARRLVEDRSGRFELVKVLVRDAGRDRGIAGGLFTTRFEEVMDAEPGVLIEVLGGLDPARACVRRALESGVNVVTANKSLISHHAEELARHAEAGGARLAYEASVCAGVPVLAALEQLRGDRVESIRAIVSGSCNYILSRMASGIRFAAALDEARARGLVEPDPSADISGQDAAEKVCILAMACGWGPVRPHEIERGGIDRVQLEDIRHARESGRVIRLVADLDFVERRLRVGPTLVPLSHPLAGVRAEENGVLIRCELAGEIFLRGLGAGPGPTAAAILGDVVRLSGSAGAVEEIGGQARLGSGRGRGRAKRASVRFAGHGHEVGPDRVLEIARGEGGRVREIALGRGSVHMEVEGLDGGERLAEALNGGSEVASWERTLVMPVLDGR
ncbi:MAG: homoserine dehydrogenase [Phycisphaeraceae bacterium]|nr:homoserine dehydrogenase [Phycisphaeraceae bacterium]